MTDGPIYIDSSQPAAPKKRWGWLFWLCALMVFITLSDLVAVLITARASRRAANEKRGATPPVTSSDSEPAPPAVNESQLQWASPTSGAPITLEYVPRGTQAIFHFRFRWGNDIGNEDEKVLDALGPWGESVIQEIEDRTGAKLTELKSLLVALHRDEGYWQATYRIELTSPWTDEALAARIANIPKDRAAFLPDQQGSMIVACPRSVFEELAQDGATPTRLARDLERLIPFTDTDRTVTLLMPAKFLDTEGRELLGENEESIRSAFDAIVPDQAGAVALSLDWGDNFFIELVATIVQNVPAHRFNTEIKTQLASASEQVTASLERFPPTEQGRLVEERLPAMLDAASDYTRTSQQANFAVARCYLPLAAGHNLILASRLRLGSPRTLPATVAEVSLAEKLRQRTTLSFPRETLEKALEMLASDTKIPVQIAGGDLQLDGITKNQSLSIDLRDLPAGKILVEILRQANPDRSAVGPADPRQKLVYVMRGDAVIVTTRAAATQRGEELPEVFRGLEP